MVENQGLPAGEIIVCQGKDGKVRVECRFADETPWLSQALIAELFRKDVRTINEHLQNIYADNELEPERTIRKFRIVRQEGQREVAQLIEYYIWTLSSRSDTGFAPNAASSSAVGPRNVCENT